MAYRTMIKLSYSPSRSFVYSEETVREFRFWVDRPYEEYLDAIGAALAEFGVL